MGDGGSERIGYSGDYGKSIFPVEDNVIYSTYSKNGSLSNSKEGYMSVELVVCNLIIRPNRGSL